MTACVNKHTKRVAAVVTASLVGALSLGAAPVAAVASNEGIATQATSQDVLDTAEVTEAVFSNGAAISDMRDIKISKANAATLGDIQVHTVKLGDEVLTDLGDGANATFTLKGYQYANSDGTHVVYDGSNYTVSSMAGLVNGYWKANTLTYAVYEVQSAGCDGYIYVPFTMVYGSLDGAFLVENGNISDTTFQWTGNPLDIQVALNDTVLTKGTDYTISVRKAGDTAGSSDLSGTALTPGTYVATVEGENGYEGSDLNITFEVGKLDLSQVTVFVNRESFSGSMSLPSAAPSSYISDMYVNGSKVNTSKFGLSYVSGPDGQQGLVDEFGAYTYSLTVTGSPEKNYVTGSKTVTVDKVDSFVGAGSFLYDGKAIDATSDFTTDYNSLNPNYFDVNDITVKENGKELPFTVKVYDQFYNEATLDDLKTSGIWHVYVAVDSDAVDYQYGGMSNEMTVTVKNATVSSANVVFAYDGKNMDTASGKYTEATYDDTDLMGHITVSVKDNKGNVLVQGKDYTLTVKNEDGKIVDSIVDAGTYTLTVTSPKYDFADGDCVLKVNPARIASLDVSNMTKFGTTEFFPYTGSAIEPEFVYATTQRPTASDYKALPDVYKVEYWYTESTDVFNENGEVVNTKATFTKVDDMSAKGTYVLVVVPDEDAEGVDNFLFDSYETIPVYDKDGHQIGIANDGAQMPWTTATVMNARVYNDVPTDFWAAQDIFTASQEGWMSGYGDTGFFGPQDNIKRGDVAMVLYKMAGQPSMPENMYTELGGWKTGFGDVDGNMYYAEAIAWAKQIGIISGDTGTDSFRPEDTISRQELAKMLSVYAEKCGENVKANADEVLSAYDDADTVADWAKGYVAWCVEADVMGQDSPLRGSDPITRAEVSTMVVRLSGLFDFDVIAK